MLALDKDAFICDMAETYHLYDIKSVPLPYLATLASGLGMDSRIRLKKHGLKAPWTTVMLAMYLDAWSRDDKATLMPLFVEKRNKGVKSNSQVFASADDFEAAKAAVLGGNTDD